MAEQLSFDLPTRAALGRDDFLIAPSNAVAVAMVENGNWPSGKLALCGPAGSGKTHLAHVWAAQSGARIVSARDLADTDIDALACGPVVVEDVPQIAANDAAEQALFHLHNLCLARGHALLLTGRDVPRRWALSLPDLQSRMEGATAAVLDDPDDALLAAVLAKLFADRQVTPRPDVIPYLVDRMERSFSAAQSIVNRLDRAALTERRALTRAFAARHLGADQTEA